MPKNKNLDEKTPLVISTPTTISTPIDQYLNWVEEALFLPPNVSHLQKVLGAAGVIGGIALTAVPARLAYDFGAMIADLVSDKLGIDNAQPAEISLGAYFASTAAPPLVALSMRLTKMVFSQLASKTPESQKHIVQQRYIKTGSSEAVLWFAGAISGTPILYLTHVFFQDMLGPFVYPLDITAYIAASINSKWALENQVMPFYDSIKYGAIHYLTKNKKSNVKAKRLYLRNKLQKSKKIISGMNDDEINIVADKIFTPPDPELATTNDNKTFNKTASFYSPNIFLKEEKKPPRKSWQKQAFGYVGYAMGIFSPVVTKPVAEITAQAFCDYFGIDDEYEKKDIIKQSTGWMTFLCQASLMSFATRDSFEKFYDAIGNILSTGGRGLKFSMRNALIYLELFLALNSSTPRTQLTIDYIDMQKVYGPMLLVCTTLAPFATDFWAMNSFMNDILDDGSEKERLIGSITMLINIIPKLKDEVVIDLHEKIKDTLDKVEREEHTDAAINSTRMTTK